MENICKIKKYVANAKWGYIRETQAIVIKSGNDKETGLFRTGLEVYLKEIFPNINDWVHDKSIPDCKKKIRPDYRSEKLKLIIEVDGLPHYQNPDVIIKDKINTKIYEDLGYKVVRIPYFIQLTKKSVKKLFGVNYKGELFDERIPSIGPKGRNTPAYICMAGVKRMNKEFRQFPEQRKTNIDYLMSLNNEEITGISEII